ncbi:MAG: MATE family efflux transporter [Anaerolineales bacterium]|nr:MAG: MATE family efflux transporter [Anaerolineales bacterium]
MKIRATWQPANRLADFFRDREYFSRLFSLAFPIALQNFVMSSLNMVGIMLIGQLGETPVAAVGLANQLFFLLTLSLFGISSGAAMFTAQLWGKGDIPNIRRVLGFCLLFSLGVALIFMGVALLAPGAALRLYSQDPLVIVTGSGYLRIFGWSYLFMAITFSYAAVLRSIGDVKRPLFVSTGALVLNTLLSYGLILGKLGFPALGVQGAALAALIARILECLVLLLLTYWHRSPVAAGLGELLRIDKSFVWRVIKPVLPVWLNELLWSLGVTTYYAIYAHIGTDSVAAMNIAASIDSLALVVFVGIGNACAILVGNRIGAGEEDLAYRYAARSLVLGIAAAILIGGLVLLASQPILSFYKVAPGVIEYSRRILLVIALFLWVRVSNMILIIGIFRSGGDTRFSLTVDGGLIWLVGVPAAYLGAFVLHLPIYWVYLLVMSDELTKFVIGLFRFASRKWIHNLAAAV